MKYSVLSCIVIVMLFACVESASAKPVTKAERKAAIEYLKHTKKLFLDSVKGLSDEQSGGQRRSGAPPGQPALPAHSPEPIR